MLASTFKGTDPFICVLDLSGDGGSGRIRSMKETIAIAGGHPDDLVGSLGLALLLKDRFDLHVLDFTDRKSVV